MKKIVYILISLFFLPVVANSQYLAVLNEFKAFEQIGDTIFYNKNRYPFVLINTKEKLGFYEVKLFQLRSLNELKNKLDVDLYQCNFKKNSNKYSSNIPIGNLVSYQHWYWNKKPAGKDFVKIRKTDGAFYVEEKNLLFPGMQKDTLTEAVCLPIELFPAYQNALRKFYSYLNFELHQRYDIYIKISDTFQINVRTPTLCNPEIKGKGTIADSTELNEILNALLAGDQVKWPKLKIEDTILSYLIAVEGIGLPELVGVELQNFKSSIGQSKPVFTNNDSVRMYIDSMNYKTTFFIPNYQDENNPTNYSKTINGYPNYTHRLVDINNDGTDDLILDSLVGSEYKYNGSVTTVTFIPNYTNNRFFIPELSESLTYSKYLGNNFYYTTYSYDRAEIFYIKNNQVIRIMGVTIDYLDKKGQLDYREYRHTWVLNDPTLTQTYQKQHPKAWHYSYLLDEKIRSYLEHPEKLPIDFPMN